LKLRLFLVFVIIYISAVFGWWLYSFISYTETEYKLEYNNLSLNAQVIHNKITQFIETNKNDFAEHPYDTYKRKEKEIKTLHHNLNRSFRSSTSMKLKDTTGKLHELIEIRTSPAEFDKIHKIFIKKQRAFYSEVIFFTILVISGVLWVFGKLESLLNLNKMQNNFLLSVTHEFKTPLTAIKLSSQTFQQRKPDENTQKVLIQQIVNNTDRLNELLDNVMLATRIDGKSYNYIMTETDISKLIARTAEQVLTAPYFTGKFVFDEAPRIILADEVSLKLVFSNLFQNAVKYAGSDAEIHVKFREEEGKLRVLVSDNGKGIDASEYKSIFNKFYRVGDENTRETKGTGLGLYLVKQILQSHRATIKAEGNEPRGTTFNIYFKKSEL
jgi:signal transduction histidine kinase